MKATTNQTQAMKKVKAIFKAYDIRETDASATYVEGGVMVGVEGLYSKKDRRYLINKLDETFGDNGWKVVENHKWLVKC